MFGEGSYDRNLLAVHSWAHHVRALWFLCDVEKQEVECPPVDWYLKLPPLNLLTFWLHNEFTYYSHCRITVWEWCVMSLWSSRDLSRVDWAAFKKIKRFACSFATNFLFAQAVAILFLYEFCVSGVSSADWGVSCTGHVTDICALKDGHPVMNELQLIQYLTGISRSWNVFWTKQPCDRVRVSRYCLRALNTVRGFSIWESEQRLHHQTESMVTERCTCTISDSLQCKEEEDGLVKPGVTLTVTGDFDEVSLFFCALCWIIISVWQQH